MFKRQYEIKKIMNMFHYVLIERLDRALRIRIANFPPFQSVNHCIHESALTCRSLMPLRLN